jgi:hypothetical protein
MAVGLSIYGYIGLGTHGGRQLAMNVVHPNFRNWWMTTCLPALLREEFANDERLVPPPVQTYIRAFRSARAPILEHVAIA